MLRATPFDDTLVQLTRFPRAFPVNCYLVREGDGLTLIDTGITGMAKMLVAMAAVVGGAIRRIALTHAHSDHAGSLDALHALVPDAEILVSLREARLMQGDRTLDPNETQVAIHGMFVRPTTQPTRLLVPGDRVGSLEVVAAPGHSPGQIAFFDPRTRALIAGDAFQTKGGVAVSGVVVPTFPFPAIATWDKATALATARHLRTFEPAVLAVGHGNLLRDPLVAMDAAIVVADRAVQKRAASAA